ncbi:MAG: phosphoribosylaminoimidazolesuccinocarboxamide synthase [Cyanobacteria bacterium J06635_15]
MRKLQSLVYSTAIAFNLAIVAPAVANCPDSIASAEYFQPAMARLWQQLQNQTNYPWGTARPYSELRSTRIMLTPAFDTLDGTQKHQVIDLLRVELGRVIQDVEGLSSFLTPEERARSRGGTLPPYSVFTDDDRLLYTAYDGCTPMRMLTERDRYSYYYLRLPHNRATNSRATPEDLRNAGNPFWRTVQFPISAADEQSLRLSFWNTVGYDKADQGWWIAWVPERRHFEINVPEDYNANDLQRFWQVTSSQYRYAVITTDGTRILER